MRHRADLPTLSALTAMLFYAREAVRRDGPLDDTTDIRLVAGWPESSMAGHWALMTGSSDYDQWHGCCESTSLDGSETLPALRLMARALFASVRGQLDA